MKYYIGDPEKNGREVSYWEYLTESGLIDGFKMKKITINPIHDSELLIKVRNDLFEEAKLVFIAGRKTNKLETGKFEIAILHIMWLKKELTVINNWLSNEYPNREKKTFLPSNSDQIEILKYRRFVLKEIKRNEHLVSKISPNKKAPESLKQTFTDPLQYHKCIASLLEVNPPIIDNKMNFLLGERQKGAIVAWVSILRKHNIIHNVNDAMLSNLLNQAFHSLKLGRDGRSLRNIGTTSYRKYHSQLLKLL